MKFKDLDVGCGTEPRGDVNVDLHTNEKYVHTFIDSKMHACMTGIQDPYEESLDPEVTLNTENDMPQQNIIKVLEKLRGLDYID